MTKFTRIKGTAVFECSVCKGTETDVFAHACKDSVSQGHTRDDPTLSLDYPWDYTLQDHCNHLWKTYHGIIEIFDYCEYCDIKKEDL
jgi:hypothetical protein